jgi:hypothetical protein
VSIIRAVTLFAAFENSLGGALEETMTDVHVWEIRNPDGGATGLEVARALMAPHEEVLGHALPERIDVEVFDGAGVLVASGTDLRSDVTSPIARLSIRGGSIDRENVWPDDSDLRKPVILPGGEVGILQAWWHADDRSEWRWTIELSNHA